MADSETSSIPILEDSVSEESILSTNILPAITIDSETLPTQTLLHSNIFLQTKAAQVIAGIFVWAALLITCQQVIYSI